MHLHTPSQARHPRLAAWKRRLTALLVCLAAVALIVGLGVVTAEAALSETVTVGSPTHPSVNTWYTDNDPQFEWSLEYPSLVGAYGGYGDPSDMAVAGDVAFVANGWSGLLALDVSDPTDPTLLYTYDTPGSSAGIAVAGDVAFVADRANGLVAFDISDPTTTTLLGTFDTPGEAFDVVVAGDVAYVADWGVGGLRAIDVSDPTSMSPLGSVSAGIALGVDVSGDVAYVGAGMNGVYSIDISDPTSMTVLDTYANGSGWGVEADGDTLYVANMNVGLQSFDVSDPADLQLLDSCFTDDYPIHFDIAGDVAFVAGDSVRAVDISDPAHLSLLGECADVPYPSCVTVDGDVAYAPTSYDGIFVVDIADLGAMSEVGSDDLPDSGRRVALDGDVLYVAANSAGLCSFDVSDPTSPTPLDVYPTSDQTFGVTIAGDVAYVADFNAGLMTLDVSDPASMTLLDTYDVPGAAPYDVQVVGNVAYVPSAGAGLQAIDVSDPASLTPLASYNTSGSAQGVVVDGNVAYVMDAQCGISVFDISDPSVLTLLDSWDSPDFTYGGAVSGDVLFAADSGGGLRAFDISDPSHLTLVDTFDTAGSAQDVVVAGNTAFVADWDSGLLAFDISDPASITPLASYDPGNVNDVVLAGDVAYACSLTGAEVYAIQVASRPGGEYSYTLDTSATTTPDLTSDTASATASFTDVADGERYFHVRALDRFGTSGGPASHRRVRISTTPPPTTYEQVAGANRYATSVAISQKAFPTPSEVGTVVVAAGDRWPDALGGSAYAGVQGAPILLVGRDSVPFEVAAEIGRLGPAKIVILGGEAAVGPDALVALEAHVGVGNVSRIAGADRYETSRMVASATVAAQHGAYDRTAFVATGHGFADSLAASPLAAAKGWPIYLVDDAFDAATYDAMDEEGVRDVLVLGGTAAVPQVVEDDLVDEYGDSHVTRLEGENRYATAVEVAQYGVVEAGLFWQGLAITTGQGFADGLTGGVLQARKDSVMLMTPPLALHAAPAAALTTERDLISEVTYLGGTNAVSQTVRNQVAAILH